MHSFLISSLFITTVFAHSWNDLCTVNSIELPQHIDPQIGGIEVAPNGSIFAVMHRGEILKYDGQNWIVWGQGLQEPLGLIVEDNDTILVAQRAELTRISDTNKDGIANSYKNICSDWGMSGNYHEFAFGPAKDQEGNLYVSLGTASNNGGVRPEIRGEWNNAGNLSYASTHPTWKSTKLKQFPRMYARVPYRGWVVKINPITGKMTPYACGLRTPHGIHVTPDGDLYINDNQGDWLGSSKLYKVKQGNFYGHPDSLIWREGWDRGVPAKLSSEELTKLRTRSVAFLPQGDLANSPTQIITLPEKGFGPYGGALIMGEMNQPRLVRYLPDQVNGKEQGAVISFLQHSKLGRGNAKIAVQSPSTLLIGKTHLSWPGDNGITELTYKDKPHLAITGVKLTPSGFSITLTSAVDADKITVKASHYGLNYHAKYGSPKISPTKVDAKTLTSIRNTLEIVLKEAPQADRIYDITLENCNSKKLGSLLEPRFFYTAHQVYTHK